MGGNPEPPADAAVERARLAERIVQLAGEIHALEAELVGELARFDAVDGWDGFRSPAQWLSVHAGFTVGDARARVTAAAAAGEMPAVMAAAREGRISAGVLADAAKVASPDIDERLAETATLLDPTQFRRVAATYRKVREPAEPCDGRPPTWWRTHWDGAGRLRVSAALDAETGALLEAGLDAARALADGDECGATTDDALAEMAGLVVDRAHDAGHRDHGGDRFGVLLTADLASFVDADPSAAAARVVGADAAIDLATLLRLTCDARLQAMLTLDGRPLAIGREHRTPSRHQRRALLARDAGCVFPGCSRTYRLHAHHARHWAHGGATDLDNLVLLCGRHHRLVHEEGWEVVVDPAGRHRWRHPMPRRRPTPLRRHRLQRPAVAPDAARPTGGSEPLTPYGMDVLVGHLLS